MLLDVLFLTTASLPTGYVPCSLPALVSAAWELHRNLAALQPDLAAGRVSEAGGGGLGGGSSSEGGEVRRVPRAMANMAAVVARRQALQALVRVFLERATAFLSDQLARCTEGVLARVAAAQGGSRRDWIPSWSLLHPACGSRLFASGTLPQSDMTCVCLCSMCLLWRAGLSRLKPPDHAPIRRATSALAPLLAVVHTMRPPAIGLLRGVYCQALNALLRREVHAAVTELRRLAAAADASPAAGAAAEPDLLMRGADSLRSLERIDSLPRGGAGAYSVAEPLSRRDTPHAAALRDAAGVPINEAYQ